MENEKVRLKYLLSDAAPFIEEVGDVTSDVNKTYVYGMKLFPKYKAEDAKVSEHVGRPLLLDLDKDSTAVLLLNNCGWIHIPANNKAVAEKCIRLLAGDEEAEYFRRKWDQQLRPAGAVPKSILPSHAWGMDSLLEESDRPQGGRSVLLLMPYLNWELYSSIMHKGGKTDKSTELDRTRHQRKTLDQFYYSGLSDTNRRDKGQTVSKWTGTSKESEMTENGRHEAVEDSLVVMVDQMWMWGSIGPKGETLVTCSPVHDSRFHSNNAAPSSMDIMGPFLNNLEFDGIFDVLEAVSLHAVVGVFGGAEDSPGDILSLYRWAIANKAARQTKLLEDFRERRQKNETEGMSDEGNEELEIALDLADVIDELYMIQRVLEQQERAAQHRLMLSASSDQLQAQRSDLKAVIADAERAHKMIIELLDLEQKAASLGEARITTKQGQAVMLFTVITVIFLPLSFFVSYFGQNVSELTGDAQNPTTGQVWKIAAPISVVVILGSLGVAFFIMYPDCVKSCLRRQSTNKTAV